MSATRALVVDDNPINLELASFVLLADGFEVECAASADEAMARARAALPDVILMDVQMPEVDGLEAVRRVRADARLRDVAVVAFTAYAMQGDRQKMLDAGCDGYIAKPIDVASFAATVRAVLRARAGA